jgi:aspartate aminotransferase
MVTFRKIEESQTLLINIQSKNLEKQQKKIYKFGFGQSPFMPPDKVLKTLKSKVHHKEYSNVQGDFELRKIVSEFHFKANGLKVDPGNIMIAPGSKILIYTILLSFEKADVFIQAPAWVSYAPQAKLAGHHAITLNTSFEKRWRITPDSIQEAYDNKKHKDTIMILNYPGNPDGLTYKESELKRIAKKVKELDIFVISDEIYALLTHKQNHHSFANYYPEKTITTTGMSKWCGAGGWRLGIALLYKGIEDDFKKALIGIASETYSCTATPIQMAAKMAYGNYESMEEYIKKQCNILNKIGTYCYTELIDSGIKLFPPEGAFYLFPDFSNYAEKLQKINISTSKDLCNKILKETGVALLPGSAFGIKSDHLVARLSYVDFEDPLQRKNLPEGKAGFQLERDCPKIIGGIQALKTWLSHL